MKERLILTLAIFSIFFIGCGKDDSNSDSTNGFGEQTGIFTFNYSYLPNDPIEVYYHIPKGGDAKKMPILFVMHGVERNGVDYRDAWINAANIKKFIVVAPTFQNRGSFAGSSGYNLGGVPKLPLTIDEQKWTFSVIEPLFDYVVNKLNGSQTKYDMWGHSAGGQFAHRYVLFKPNARIDRAVSANAGWYTVPDFTVDFPYGLKSAPLTEESLSKSFNHKLYIQLGTADTDSNSNNLEHNTDVDKQGLNRYARGNYFWDESGRIASDNAFYSTFNWQKREVLGVSHSYTKMSADAAIFLY